MIPLVIDILEIQPIEEHFSRIWVIETLEKADDRTFTAPRGTNEGNDLVSLDIDADSL